MMLIWLVSVFVPLPLIASTHSEFDIRERSGLTAFLEHFRQHGMPRQLSQTGLYEDVATRNFAHGIVPYNVNTPFWSNGAIKERYIALPNKLQVGFSAHGNWTFPDNSVLIKNFYLDLIRGDPASRIPVETRILIKAENEGGWQGFGYRWDEYGKDAVLVPEALEETFYIIDETTVDGIVELPYFYPGPNDCQVCHRRTAGSVLGVNTRQLNRDSPTGNQLLDLAALGLFSERIGNNTSSWPRLTDPHDTTRSLDDRARSYLDVNCSGCHRPHGVPRAVIDLRAEVPLAKTNTVNWSPYSGLLDAESPRIISPGDPGNSVLYRRLLVFDSNRMPPIASTALDQAGANLLHDWIASLDAETLVTHRDDRPTRFRLFPNFPNPFNANTVIRYSLRTPADVDLVIYDILGRKIRSLVDSFHPEGEFRTEWDGRNDDGSHAGTGVYFGHLKAGAFNETRRLTILR
tara:strand:- start:3 stop:1385 length:1383 start_codon:yes stop_codon:yes gene_type:complete